MNQVINFGRQPMEQEVKRIKMAGPRALQFGRSAALIAGIALGSTSAWALENP
jgi:hypothetical protein